jgi:oxalate decarboxylase/phosphoglucose isomerase-like protein (cupin superfamily)
VDNRNPCCKTRLRKGNQQAQLVPPKWLHCGGRRGQSPLILCVCLCRHASPTGLLLTVLVALVYVVAILYEE